MGDVTPMGVRCDYNEQDDADRITRCSSRNARWVDDFQGNLCMVHEAARAQAKAKHPAGKARPAMQTFYDPTEVIKILRDELKAANSREALEGYFDHLIDDDVLQRSLVAYSGEDLGTKQSRDDD